MEFSLTLLDYKSISTEESAYHCAFSNCDGFIVCASQEGVISVYKSNDYEFVTSVVTANEIKSLFVIPGNVLSLTLPSSVFGATELIIICRVSEMVDISVLVLHNHNYHIIYPMKKVDTNHDDQLFESRKEESSLICCTVSWDGKYVAVATDSFLVLVYDISTRRIVAKYNGNNG